MTFKVCAKCNTELPATSEYFRKGKGNKYGLRGHCKSCEKQYREENKERIKQYREENKERAKQWREENKERIKQYREENKERAKQWREENKERLSEYEKQWREENKERLSEYEKQYREENKERRSVLYRQWQKENKHLCRQARQKRRARKKSLPNTLTLKQWESIVKKFKNSCAYCGKKSKLAQEHFIPLCKGGHYTIQNIIPSCKSCNSSKNGTLFEDWYPTYKHYSKEREEFIYKYLESVNYKQQTISERGIV